MRIKIEVIATRDRGQTDVKVTEGLFTFVAIDEQARPRPVDEPAAQ
jgi:acyl-CoA thioesterase YciA